MKIDRLIFPVHVLGPGNRIAIWTAGCPHRCHGCANPELWESGAIKDISVGTLYSMIEGIVKINDAAGVTITGGEPFNQIDALDCLLKMIRQGMSKQFEVLIYTGYTHMQLQSQQDPKILSILEKTDVLIDGLYIAEQNDNKTPLRGSTNQNIIYLNEPLKEKYEGYMQQGRKIQNVYYGDSLISIGIHNTMKGCV